MRQIDEIILHCSATKAGQHFTVDDIGRWHKELGFAEIGYHYVIYIDGSVHTGRSEDLIGAHCVGHNATSIGVCYIGGISLEGKAKDTRTAKQKAALKSLVNKLKVKYPKAKVYGHKEFAKKDCPCFDVKKEFRK